MNTIPSDQDKYNESLNRAIQFRVSLSAESDRGCALMACAYLEARLIELLQLSFIEDRKVSKRVFEKNGALSTFSSCIDLSYMIGYLPKSVKADLDTFRKIRNEFAHQFEPLDFSSDKILKQCQNLSNVILGSDSSGRDLFLNAAMCLLSCIDTRIVSVKRPPVPVDNVLTKELREQLRVTIEKMATRIKL